MCGLIDDSPKYLLGEILKEVGSLEGNMKIKRPVYILFINKEDLHEDLPKREATPTVLPPISFPKTKRKRITPSYGVIAICKKKIPKYLLIKRRDTYSYLMLIRGFWKDEKDVRELFITMTRKEQKRVLRNTFDVLWDDAWCKSPGGNRMMDRYESSKKKFELVSKMKPLLSGVNESSYSSWEFPKGKRERTMKGLESEYECAMREFEEETLLDRKILRYTGIRRKEIYEGSDGRTYSTDYFVCLIADEYSCPKRSRKSVLRTTLTDESDGFGWFTLKECIKLLGERSKVLLSRR